MLDTLVLRKKILGRGFMSRENISPRNNYDRERRRRQRIRRNKMKRRLFFLFLCFVFIVGIGSRITKAMAGRSDEIEATSVKWHLAQIEEQPTPVDSVVNSKYNPQKDIAYLAENKLVGFTQPLVKGSNHVKSAMKYAYGAGEIKDIIQGKKTSDGKKLVFLTFDDGPNNTITPKILDILKEHNVHGTFFVVGKNLGEKHRGTLLREVLEGHGIATHSVTHDYKKLYPSRVGNTERIVYEVNKSNELLQGMLGEDFKSNVFRYPGGHMSWSGLEAADNQLAKQGVNWIDWNCLTGDAEAKRVRPTTSEGIIEYLDKSLKKNTNTDVAVVLLHDAENKQLTVDSLPSVIKYFKDRGYSFGILK